MKSIASKANFKDSNTAVYSLDLPTNLLHKLQGQDKSPAALNMHKVRNPLKNCHTSGSALFLAN